MGTDHAPKATPCAFCPMPIYGGPGGWHDILGFERCTGASITGFHEPAEEWVPRSSLHPVGWRHPSGTLHASEVYAHRNGSCEEVGCVPVYVLEEGA